MKQNKKWAIAFLVYVSLLFLILGGITGIIDPFFHYHKPLVQLQYPLSNARYLNNGIIRHFDYDAMIVGTSMTDNFRTSQLDSLMGVRSVKVSTQGASFAEIRNNIRTALEEKPRLKLVLMAMDSWFIKEIMYGSEIIDSAPTFLYDSNPFNDVEYLLNKEVLFSNSLEVLAYTRQGGLTTSFDDYNSWRDFVFGREETLRNHTRPEKTEDTWEVTADYLALLESTVETEFLSLVREYPDVTFICYFPPYSALFWDKSNQYNSLENDVIVLQEFSRLLLQEENLQLYSFHDDFEITTDLNNYRDDCHHTGEVNSRILEKIHAGEHRLTPENYRQYWEDFLTFYEGFDFEALFQP